MTKEGDIITKGGKKFIVIDILPRTLKVRRAVKDSHGDFILSPNLLSIKRKIKRKQKK